jgi:hypothetical protein
MKERNRLRKMLDEAREDLARDDAVLRWLVPVLVLIALPALVFLILSLT